MIRLKRHILANTKRLAVICWRACNWGWIQYQGIQWSIEESVSFVGVCPCVTHSLILCWIKLTQSSKQSLVIDSFVSLRVPEARRCNDWFKQACLFYSAIFRSLKSNTARFGFNNQKHNNRTNLFLERSMVLWQRKLRFTHVPVSNRLSRDTAIYFRSIHLESKRKKLN